MAQESHSPVLVFDSPVMVLHSPVMVLHSLVLVFTQSSFNFYTVQFYFFTQSSFIFCVVTRPLSLYCNTCYLTAAILYFLATMDSIIRQVVREELRRKQIRCGWIITKFVFNTNSGPLGVFLKRRPENEDLRPEGGVLPYKGLMGTCSQPGYVFRDFCHKQCIDFIIKK